MKQLSLIIVLLLSVLSVAGQSSADIDRKTYDLYQEGKWKELTEYYRKQVDPAKVDFYYLRMRVGIAWYELENYFNAIPHFQKAMRFNSNPVVKEYLFYSYLYTGQRKRANMLYRSMKQDQKKELSKPDNSFFQNLSFEYGLNISDAFEKNGAMNFIDENKIYGEAPFMENTRYWNVSLHHRIGDAVSVKHGISSFKIQNKMKFCLSTEDEMVVPFEIDQTDYYFNLNAHSKNNNVLSLSFHTMAVDYMMPEMQFLDSIYILSNTEVTLNDYLFYASWGTHLGNIFASAGASASYINGGNQQQFDLEMSWMPLGNYSVVPSLKLSYYQQQESEYTEKQQEWLLTPAVSFSLTDDLWMNASYTLGDIYQYHEQKGFVVYNNPDRISRKAESVIQYKLSESFSLSLSYRYQKREGQSLTYIDEDTNEEKIFNFTTHYIIGGIVWKL